ncbi:hypothetical protein LTR62_001306 [Meristemomyces frigidus]|uniref:Uncharacterized protein n=1 Tax=Meristemomyces frigidus TaxID=1508187 RepID=A0AAN7YL52_9PEZI|nr:hypothetical protein LTR62_001306 [Meristemomyces frigidus]
MHLPQQPFGEVAWTLFERGTGLTFVANRFEVLASLPQAMHSPAECHLPGRKRQSRNNRGTKDAKRRRDARRSRRKMAAQMLDEQLSREIGAALEQLKFTAGPPPPPSSVSPSTPPSPTAMIRYPQPNFFPRRPPTPPELPSARFFELDSTPLSKVKPTEITTFLLAPAMSPPMSSWSPPLPSLIRKRLSTEHMPIFYDLSRLPEPTPKVKSEPAMSRAKLTSPCQELQLWRSIINLKPKRSRFFPLRTASPQMRVKLPQTVYKLHETDVPFSTSPLSCADAVKKGAWCTTTTSEYQAAPETYEVKSQSVPIFASSSAHSRQTLLTDYVFGPSIPSTQDKTSLSIDGFATNANELHAQITPSFGSSAANLWDILADTTPHCDTATNDPYVASLTHCEQLQNSYDMAWQENISSNPLEATPAEMDGREIPYVHGNSLADSGVDMRISPYTTEHADIMAEIYSATPTSGTPMGLNELMMDREYEEVMPATKYYAAHPYELADILPIDCFAPAEDSAHVQDRSAAHFDSEQALFRLATPPLNITSENLIDLAEFLKLGHGRNCWCNGWCDDCQTDTTAVDSDITPELLVATPEEMMTEAEEEWILFMSSSTTETTSPLSTVATATDVDEEEEKDGSRTRCTSGSDWIDLFSSTCVPKVAEPLVQDGWPEDCDWV